MDNDISIEKQGRIDKLNKLKTIGINPYPNEYKVTHNSKYIIENFEELEKNKTRVSLAGRIVLYRIMGKATFLTLKDTFDKIQIYVSSDKIGEHFYNDIFKRLIDTGDIIGVQGEVFKTQKGETSIYADKITLLTKALNPLPEKFHGLTDTELRYRQRYVDLIVNDESKSMFVKRSKMISFIRETMTEEGFLEVETPIMHPILGGAKARPFITHHNTLDMDLYLRVAPELYLKRLIVGGFNRVFEIGRNFRNEGISTRHNPEFTMLEAYMSYSNVFDVIDIVEKVFSNVCFKLNESYQITYKNYKINFKPPFKRISMIDIVKQNTALDFNEIKDDEKALDEARKIGVCIDTNKGRPSKWEIMVMIFEDNIEHTLIEPTFILDYPKIVSPLSKSREDNPDITERFELFIAGMEMSNGFTELNDPIDQKERFDEQAKNREKGDEEAMEMDYDFLNALEYGLPPTGGVGMGIDRMAMLFLNVESIRDVILFPHMRKI